MTGNGQGGWLEGMVAGGMGSALAHFLGLDTGDYMRALIILGTIVAIVLLVVYVIYRTIRAELREYRHRASDFNQGLNESFDRFASRTRGRFSRRSGSDDLPRHGDLIDPPSRQDRGPRDRSQER